MTGLETLRRTGTMTLALVGSLMLATPTLAACALTAKSVAKAEVVFVGLLSGVSPEGPTATFEVEDVWRGTGPIVGSPIVIDTLNPMELAPPNTPAFRYLVLATTVGGQLRTGDGCDLGFPFPWDASYVAFRPADAPAPPESTTAGGVPGAVLLAAGVVLLLGVVGVFAFRRGSG